MASSPHGSYGPHYISTHRIARRQAPATHRRDDEMHRAQGHEQHDAERCRKGSWPVPGLVNLHFESKENLLTETLATLAGEYREKFDKAVDNAGPDAADKLWAIMEHDLRPSICNRAKLAVWFAFWGEVKQRPTYQRMCAEWDQRYDDVVEALCDEIVAEGNYQNVSAAAVAYTLAPMINGFWLSCLISPQSWSRDAAKSAVLNYLTSVFPQHFPRDN